MTDTAYWAAVLLAAVKKCTGEINRPLWEHDAGDRPLRRALHFPVPIGGLQ